jgi:hypothetical protein
MADGRIFLKCVCGDYLMIARTHFDFDESVARVVGGEDLKTWLQAHIAPHGELHWEPVDITSRFSIEGG